MPRESVPVRAIPITATDEGKARFQQLIEKSASGCWLWRGFVGPEGYGTYSVHARKYLAHRFAYTAFVGPIPIGLTIDHLCRTPRCVNPAHLEPVTIRENALRAPTSLIAQASAKTACKRGHALDGNRICRGRPTRYCKTCAQERTRAQTAKTSAARRRANG